MTNPFEVRRWPLAHGRFLTLGPRSIVMGILNVTPDSFSDGGRFQRPDYALAHAQRMVGEGAAIIDIGGESTRPGGKAVGAAEEQDRVLPVIEAVARHTGTIISVDTYRADTARLAIAAGAHIVNDIWGLQRDPDLGGVIAQTGSGAILMHSSRARTVDPDPIADQSLFLNRSLRLAEQAGIGLETIVLDPGFGFGKEKPEQNVELMRRFGELHTFGRPLLVGTSRKRFVGYLTGREAGARDAGTAATSVVLRLKGAAIFRVHDVAINVDALKVTDAMLARPDES